jgi:TonB family protein
MAQSMATALCSLLLDGKPKVTDFRLSCRRVATPDTLKRRLPYLKNPVILRYAFVVALFAAVCGCSSSPMANTAAPVMPKTADLSGIGCMKGTVPDTIRGAGRPFVPPILLSSIHPQYTSEAAALRIQGEVTLQVRFLTTGEVEVLRVVNGLGHGLDEQAVRAVEQLRFKPARLDGRPVDHTTLFHVTFQLP